MRRALRTLLIGVGLTGVSVGITPAVHAQAFDGTWTGTDSCPPYANQTGWSEVRTATIVQNQFRLERNSSTLYELTQGTVQADGSISASGQGQRRDRPFSWNAQFSGRASVTTIKLTGTRSRGRPCVIELSNTRPAPYSLAGAEIARRNQVAQAEADRAAAEAETARRNQIAQTEADKPQKKLAEKEAAKQQAAKAERQRLIAEAEAAKQKAAEAERQLAEQRATQEKAAKGQNQAKSQSVDDLKQKVAEAERQLAEQRATQEKAAKEQNEATRQSVDDLKQKVAEAERQLAEQRAAQEKASKEQNQATSQRIDAIGGVLGATILPTTERRDDWIVRKTAIPIQQQEFCRIIDQFHDDLAQVRQVNNEIRLNMLYRNRKKDLEALLPNGAFENWLVNVKAVTQANDGSAAILLQPPCRVMLASDACQKNGSEIRATIKKDTPPFREIEKVGQGDFVVVSGKILYAAEEVKTPELPQYALYKPGEYCSQSDGVKEQETFVTDINYFVQLR